MTDPTKPLARRPIRSRHPNFWTAVGALAAVASVVVSIVALGPREHGAEERPKATPDAPVSPSASTAGETGPRPDRPTLEATPSPAIVLGRDVEAATTEPCRSPTTAVAAAWQIGPVQIGGHRFDTSYYCNLFAGSVGSLHFVLGRSFRSLRASIGFVDGSAATNGTVRFEFIGDGRTYLAQPVILRFGEIRDLSMDVADITQLEVKISELSTAGSTQSPSNPALVMMLAKGA